MRRASIFLDVPFFWPKGYLGCDAPGLRDSEYQKKYCKCLVNIDKAKLPKFLR